MVGNQYAFFITNCFIFLSFWASVFCRNFSSKVKLESTICFFIPLIGCIFWQGGTKDVTYELSSDLLNFTKIWMVRDPAWHCWHDTVDTVSWLLFIPLGDNLPRCLKLFKTAVVNMFLEKWLSRKTRPLLHYTRAKSLFVFWTYL